MNDNVTGALQARIKELGLKQKFIASKVILSEVHLCNQLKGKALIQKDEFYQLCGLLNFNPKELMKQFPLDFNSNGSISAMDFRPRCNQI